MIHTAKHASRALGAIYIRGPFNDARLRWMRLDYSAREEKRKRGESRGMHRWFFVLSAY